MAIDNTIILNIVSQLTIKGGDSRQAPTFLCKAVLGQLKDVALKAAFHFLD